MAMALAGTSATQCTVLDNLPSGPNCASTLTLLAYGRYFDIPTSVYVLMLKCEGKGNRILLTLEVDEITSMVQARDCSGKLLYKSDGGLYFMVDTMHLRWPDNTPIGYLVKNCIVETGDGCEQRLISLTCKEENGSECYMDVSTNSTFKKHQNTTALNLYANCYGPAMKVLMIMSALRIYYGVYRLHLDPAPTPIPVSLPPGSPTYRSESIMAGNDDLIIRAACVTADQILYFDIISLFTKEVLMVVSCHCKDSHMELLDEYGVTIFSTKYIAQKNKEEVYMFDGTLIGDYNNCSEEINVCNNPSDTAVSTRMSVTEKHGVFTVKSCDGRVEIATLQGVCGDTIVQLNILQDELECRCRAMIMMMAIARSKLHYRLQNLPLPTVTSYQFRRYN